MPLKSDRNLVVGIYYHPEGYPPTLNAVAELSDCFDRITIIYRPNLIGTWKYPANVEAIPSGAYISSRNQENAPVRKKISFFFNFLRLFFKSCQKHKPGLVLLYDSMALYAYHLLRPFLTFDHKVWYHNHDVVEMKELRKYSIGWFAAKAEHKAFSYISIFSLPAEDRLPFFPIDRFAGRFFFIPNYPSRRFYSRFYIPRKLATSVKIIFQGRVGPYHGLEEIVPLLAETIENNYELELICKGFCAEEFRTSLLDLALRYGVKDKIRFEGLTPYNEVPRLSATCNIGIAIFTKNDVMNLTLGTASNKIYEYAAVGLPVIYNGSEHFTRYLGKYAWALPTEVTTEDIREKIARIIRDYDRLSAAAHQDFMQEVNFENGFAALKSFISVNGG
ncbi:MAG: glycosyltransferase [Chitinophagaceae bacterium]